MPLDSRKYPELSLTPKPVPNKVNSFDKISPCSLRIEFEISSADIDLSKIIPSSVSKSLINKIRITRIVIKRLILMTPLKKSFDRNVPTTNTNNTTTAERAKPFEKVDKNIHALNNSGDNLINILTKGKIAM
jgi:hypothetical protein